MKIISAISCLILSVSLAFSQGRIFIPEPPARLRLQTVHLQRVDATVELKNGVGTVTLDQVFRNSSPFRLEGEYLFPLPEMAQIYDFELYMNGKKTPGEVLDAENAAKIYRNIVRKLRDPALLEYSGNGLFRAKIFPIDPKKDRRIELSYAQVLSRDAGTCKFTLPIRQSGEGRLKQFHLKINLEETAPISNIYSPTHSIDIERLSKSRVRISLEESDLEGNKDFVLYYSVSEKEIGANLLTYRPRSDRDGYFLLMISPGFENTETRTIPKDVVFVVDCSGSMRGQKIEQAKQALTFCVNALHPEDRFEIIRFSSSLENFQGGLKNAGVDEKKNAEYFIENLRASGGTNIDAALRSAFHFMSAADNRPANIVFLTDGLPTEGETGIKNILQHIEDEKKDFVRIFSFGVGYDVNTFLLDKLTRDSHGNVKYVKPGENINQEVSNFFAKISDPVLTNPRINFRNLGVNDFYPLELPDIFRGQRVMIFGRYRKSGRTRLRLSGVRNKKEVHFDYEIKLPAREGKNEFIAKLWAQRKVARLLESIRFNGENPELVESIKVLGKKYGIVTPYTSYLVREQEKELAEVQDNVRSGRGGIIPLRLESQRKAREKRAAFDAEDLGSPTAFRALSAAPMAAAKSVGKTAVTGSRILKKFSTADKEMDMIITIRRIGDKTFQLKEGIWRELGTDFEQKSITQIKFLSDSYFNLSKREPEVRRILALGEKVLFSWKAKFYEIVE